MEKTIAKKIEKMNPQFRWKNIADRYGTGVPDRLILELGEKKRVALVEFKHLKELPKYQCKLKLQPKQATWLTDWKSDGGFAFVIVGVGKEKVAVFSKNFISLKRLAISRKKLESMLINCEDVAKVLQAEMDGQVSK